MRPPVVEEELDNDEPLLCFALLDEVVPDEPRLEDEDEEPELELEL